MLENWNKPQKPEEAELEERLKAARDKLSRQQMMIKEHGLPVLVLFEGMGNSRKGKRTWKSNPQHRPTLF